MEFSEVYVEYYSDIDPLTFEEVMTSDPTSAHDRCGHYVKWIANMYRKGVWKIGDKPETISALTLLEKHKAKLTTEKRDINRYTSVSHLYDNVKVFDGVVSQREMKSEAKSGAEKSYEDEEWLIVVPHTVDAAKLYGKHTKWCTSAEKNNMFDYYNGKGPLYIFVDKSNNRKYQVHFETEQFMDEEDKPVFLRKIGVNEGVKQWLNSIGKELWLVYDWIGSFDEGFASVRLNDKWNYFNTEGKLISNTWFDGASYFRDGFSSVKLNGKWNHINTEGKLISKTWFDWVCNFYDGVAIVKLNNKYNYINTNGQLLSQQWFDEAYCFSDGFGLVRLDDKYNYINTEGEYLSQQWFDRGYKFRDGYASVKLNGKYNFINTEGEYLSQQWFYFALSFESAFAKVKLNGK